MGLVELCLILAIFHTTCSEQPLPDQKPSVTVDFDGEIEPVKEGNYHIEEEDDVVILTRETFHSFLLKEKVLLVEFYAPWCGHCKQLAPIYSEAAAKLKKSDIKLAKVDATKEASLAEEFNVRGYPTLVLFREGVKVEEFDGSRTVDGLVEYMQAKADPNWKPPPSSVLVLTKDNFTSTVKKAPLILVEFYAPWCKHCKRLEPEYEVAAKQLKLHDIPLAKVDGTVENELTEEYKVTGYPALKVFRFGRAYDFVGERNGNGIVEYMKKQALPPSRETISIKETRNLMNRLDVTIVGFFTEETSLYEEYIAACNEMREKYTFLHTFKNEVIEELNMKPNSVVVFQPTIFHSRYEEPHYVFDKKSGISSELVTFFTEKSVPLVGLRTKDNEHIRYRKYPLVVVYYEVSFTHQYVKATQITRNKVLDVANEFRNFTFAICNEDSWMDEMKALGFEDSGEEINVGLWNGKVKYRMEPQEDFNPDVLKDFIKSVEKGKIESFRKSQAIPRKQEGPVRIIVANSFDKEVLASKKDVLIEFYAPWCGHCKKLEPIYKKLAKKYQENNDIVIAKMDATANDLPEHIEVTGFPTIYFFKAFNKQEPIQYEGERSLADLKSFVDKHSSVFLTEEDRISLGEHTEL